MVGSQGLGPRDVNGLPSRPADARVNYATSDPLQFGELRLPKGRGPFPVAIVIHGGCWVSTFATLQNTAAVADALRNASVATWNVETRFWNYWAIVVGSFRGLRTAWSRQLNP